MSHVNDIWSAHSKEMMPRMIESMREMMQSDPSSANAYPLLLLNLIKVDLIRAFDDATASLGQASAPKTSEISLIGNTSGAKFTPSTFGASDKAFDAIYGTEDIKSFRKMSFLIAIQDAFSKVRLDPNEITQITPFAHRALDAELVSLYKQFRFSKINAQPSTTWGALTPCK